MNEKPFGKKLTILLNSPMWPVCERDPNRYRINIRENYDE